ncbi:MFS transporter [Natronoglycomyces albus]|uniref:MFS transporter n=1 Tax=Natronoglycomyces albus TaxID=2811108 RepID=A0A895XI32_9ACTN|nr:MFS transporter [Natronoglycomyces albus]QSB04994.1 MFS transporter [Natronoglycomyces albus]
MPLPLIVLAIGAFGIGMTEFVVMGILPNVAESLDVSLPSAGLLISAYALGVVVGAPMITMVATKMERKKFLLILMGCFTAANMLSVIAPDYWTLLGSRFLSGLPHGAYFGAAAVVGAGMVSFDRRARAIAVIMSGLTLATVFGVPLGTLVAQQTSWRFTFLIVTAIGLITMIAIHRTVPNQADLIAPTSPQAEVRALGNRRVVMTLLTGTIGFGGLFACYAYITPILTDVTGFRPTTVAFILALTGIGFTAGNFIGGHVADLYPQKGLYVAFSSLAVALTAMYFSVETPVAAVVAAYIMANTAGMISPILQRLLLDAAHEAPSLASALHHSAFNLANAHGAWLGGMAISLGFGLASPILVGTALALTGLLLSVGVAWAHRDKPPLGAAPATSEVTAEAQLKG